MEHVENQHAENFVYRLYMEAGFAPSQVNTFRVLAHVERRHIATANELLARLPHEEYVEISEGAETANELLSEALEAIWAAFEKWN